MERNHPNAELLNELRKVYNAVCTMKPYPANEAYAVILFDTINKYAHTNKKLDRQDILTEISQRYLRVLERLEERNENRNLE